MPLCQPPKANCDYLSSLALIPRMKPSTDWLTLPPCPLAFPLLFLPALHVLRGKDPFYSRHAFLEF